MKYKLILIYLRLDNKKINKTKNKEIMAFKMKNKVLAKSAKSRTPMQANYSPMKIDFLKDMLRKGDQAVSDFGDYYSKSKVGKFMGSLDDRFGKLGDAYSKSKAGKFMGKMDKAISNPKSLFSGKKSKRNKAVK